MQCFVYSHFDKEKKSGRSNCLTAGSNRESLFMKSEIVLRMVHDAPAHSGISVPQIFIKIFGVINPVHHCRCSYSFQRESLLI